MYSDISTTETFPKTFVVRNTPNGMIWQIYHVKNFQEASGLAIIAKSNGFYGLTLEDYQPGYDETWPGWRLYAESHIIGENYVPTEQDKEDYNRWREQEQNESDANDYPDEDMMGVNVYTTPTLTLKMCKQGKVSQHDYYPRHVMELLVDQHGYKNLGWVNGGVVPPALDDWMEQYRNQSGSYTIMVSHSTKQIYCVDMGD